MAGIKEKISATMDKLTHRSHTDPNTTGGYSNTGELRDTQQTTGTGYGTTSTGAGTGGTTEYGTGGAGYDNSGTTSGYGAGTGTTTGTGAQSLGHTTTTTGTGDIIDQERFTKTEDHEVLVEKKQYELQHKPMQKEYVVETKFIGEQPVPGKPTEFVGQEEQAIDERVRAAPAGDRTVVVENVDVPESTRATTGATTGRTGGTTY